MCRCSLLALCALLAGVRAYQANLCEWSSVICPGKLAIAFREVCELGTDAAPTECPHRTAYTVQAFDKMYHNQRVHPKQIDLINPVEAPVGIAGDTNAVVMGELTRVLNIRCMAYGYPMPFIQWFRGLSGPMVPYSSSLYEARGSVLQIRRLDYDTLGDYACQAYNGVGKPASWSVVVKAYRPEGDDSDNPYLVDRQERVPIIPREPITEATTTPAPEITIPVYTVPVSTRILSTATTVATGAQLTLPCEVDGYPEPEVRWTKDGVPLVASDRIDITETRLTITSTNINDSGLYGCHASNAFSSHSSTLQITVEGLYIPPTCKDNPFFANCHLIVRSKFCTHKYYSNFCCKSCVEAGLLNPQDLDILLK